MESLALFAGVTPRTLDKYGRVFEALGILAVERRKTAGEKINLPNVWRLIEPSESSGAVRSTTSAVSDTTVVQPTAHLVAQPTAHLSQEEEDDKNPPPQRGVVLPVPPLGNRRRDLAAFRDQVRAYAVSRFGDVAAVYAVTQAINAGARSNNDVDEHVAQWFPELIGRAA